MEVGGIVVRSKLRKRRVLYIGVAVIAVVAALIIWIHLSESRTQLVLAGQNIVVTVTADSLEDMYGYQFRLNYDKEELEYEGTLTSKIEDIQNIFSEPMEGYELVGATMIGEKSGVFGQDKQICEMVFTVKKDGTLTDLGISISDINVVTSELQYVEGVDGWRVESALR